MTKKCSKCKLEKELDLFARNKSSKSGRSHNCKECQSAYIKNHYIKNKNYYLKKARKNDLISTIVRREFLTWLKIQPCLDCRKEFPPEVMDFDHIDGIKSFNISQAKSWYSWDALITEIRKCEVVCANCHRIRTERRRKEVRTQENSG